MGLFVLKGGGGSKLGFKKFFGSDSSYETNCFFKDKKANKFRVYGVSTLQTTRS